jgi:hypothetical protein
VPKDVSVRMDANSTVFLWLKKVIKLLQSYFSSVDAAGICAFIMRQPSCQHEGNMVFASKTES